jgi:hypothetical protein
VQGNLLRRTYQTTIKRQNPLSNAISVEAPTDSSKAKLLSVHVML